MIVQKGDPISDRKASQRKNSARFRLRPVSPTGRPSQTPLPNFDPCLRPGMHRTPAYNSSPTGAVRADWDQPTGDARSMRTRKRTEKVRHVTQVNRNSEDRTLYTCRTIPCNLPGMSEPKQCCGRRHFPLQCCGRHQLPYQTNTVRLPHVPLGHRQCCGRRHLP